VPHVVHFRFCPVTPPHKQSSPFDSLVFSPWSYLLFLFFVDVCWRGAVYFPSAVFITPPTFVLLPFVVPFGLVVLCWTFILCPLFFQPPQFFCKTPFATILVKPFAHPFRSGTPPPQCYCDPSSGPHVCAFSLYFWHPFCCRTVRFLNGGFLAFLRMHLAFPTPRSSGCFFWPLVFPDGQFLSVKTGGLFLWFYLMAYFRPFFRGHFFFFFCPQVEEVLDLKGLFFACSRMFFNPSESFFYIGAPPQGGVHDFGRGSNSSPGSFSKVL